jgi:hypothetical protein
MTVHAANLTFRDLIEHTRPARATDQHRDFACLVRRFDVVELQERDVSFAAVDAGMFAQVRVEERQLFIAFATHLASRPRDIDRFVPDVVLPSDGRVTRATAVLPRPSGSVSECELVQRFVDAAVAATLQDAEIPHRQLLDDGDAGCRRSRCPAKRNQRLTARVLELRTLAPIELHGCPAAVAVAAANVALRDLCHDQRYQASAYEARNWSAF